MLEQALAADPNLARRVLQPLAGTVFPFQGGMPTCVANRLVKYTDTNCTEDSSGVTELSDGKVGIGTTTPNNRLEVAGTTFNRITASVSADVQTGYQWKKTGANATDWEAFVPAGSTALRFYNAGDRMTLLANGNLGIGTTNPGYSLEVNGSINIAETGVFRIGGTGVLNKGASANDLNIGGGFTGYLALFSGGGAERIRIKSDGKVGIGTTDPKRPLHVKGGDIIVEKGGGFGLIEPGNADPNTVLYRPGVSTSPPGEGSDITILRTYKNEEYASPKYTLLKIWAPPNAFENDREATLALARGDNDEEVLDVYNNGYSTEKQYGARMLKKKNTVDITTHFRDFVFDQAETDPPNAAAKLPAIMVLKATRKVGIGIRDNLTARLTIRGDFSAKGTVSVVSGSQTTVTGSNTLFKQEIDVGDRIRITTTSGTEERTVSAINSETSLTVSTAFNGTASGATMTVINNLLRLDDSSGNVKVFVTDQGKVGLGTTSPAATLDVQGDAHHASHKTGCRRCQKRP